MILSLNSCLVTQVYWMVMQISIPWLTLSGS